MGSEAAVHVSEAISPHELQPGHAPPQPKLTNLDLQVTAPDGSCPVILRVGYHTSTR